MAGAAVVFCMSEGKKVGGGRHTGVILKDSRGTRVVDEGKKEQVS